MTLIQSVLSALPTYYMSIFRMPVGIRDIEKLMRDFFWENAGKEHFRHLVTWEKVCKPKNLGGLGLGNSDNKNLALLSK